MAMAFSMAAKDLKKVQNPYFGHERLPLGQLQDQVVSASMSPSPKSDCAPPGANVQTQGNISACLRDGMQLILYVSPLYRRDTWIEATYSEPSSHPDQTKWKFKDVAEALAKGLGDISCSSVSFEIHIFAPHPRDPGQLICLWRRTNELAKFLAQMEDIASITVQLENSKNVTWYESGMANNSIPDPYYERYDHETSLLPFGRLRNVTEFRILSPEGIPDGVFDWKYILAMENMIEGIKEPFDENTSDLDKTINDGWVHTDTFLNMRLLHLLPGTTARMLRLEQHKLDR
jgi:hypothetical protein